MEDSEEDRRFLLITIPQWPFSHWNTNDCSFVYDVNPDIHSVPCFSEHVCSQQEVKCTIYKWWFEFLLSFFTVIFKFLDYNHFGSEPKLKKWCVFFSGMEVPVNDIPDAWEFRDPPDVLKEWLNINPIDLQFVCLFQKPLSREAHVIFSVYILDNQSTSIKSTCACLHGFVKILGLCGILYCVMMRNTPFSIHKCSPIRADFSGLFILPLNDPRCLRKFLLYFIYTIGSIETNVI